MKTSFGTKVSLSALATVLALTAEVPLAYALDELVVTARKRSENLQDVPIAITAFGGPTIEKARIADMADIAALTPGLTFLDFGSGALKTPIIRGLAQTDPFGQDGNVGVFLDGFFLASRNTMDIGIIDLERIEVVKGPQNALYGRNTFAGAINYVTAEPGDELEGYVSGSVGTDEYYEVKGSVGGPIVEDKLKARISMGYKEFDGTFENAADGNNIQGDDSFNVLGNVVLTPNDDWTIKLMGYYGEQNYEQDAVHNVEPNCPSADPVYFCGDLPFKDPVDVKTDTLGFENEFAMGGLTVSWDLGFATLSSLTSLSTSTNKSLTDYDASSTGTPYSTLSLFFAPGDPVNLLNYASFNEEVDTYSQEIRLQSPDEDRFTWMTGVYFYNAEYENQNFSVIDSSPIPDGFQVLVPCGIFEPLCDDGGVSTIFDEPATASESETDIWAIYAQGSFDFTDRLNATAELRYTHEEKETTTTVGFLYAPVANPVPLEGSWNFLAPRFTVDFAVNDDVLLYGSAAMGVKSGGFNASISPLFPDEAFFDEETNWTYELGVKSTLFDGKVRANAAVFYVEWDDLQVPSQSQDATFLSSVVRNLGTATSTGVELELDFSVTDSITIGGNYAYANPEFDEGIDLGLSSICTDPSLCSTNVAGQQLGRTVKNTFSAYLDVVQPLANGLDIFGRIDYSYRDESPVRAANLQFIDSRQLVNANIGLSAESWELSLWARNLFDENYVTSQIRQPRLSDFTSPTTVLQGDGRIVGVTGKFKF